MDRAITTSDIPWWGYKVWLWTCIECDLAIICACVPCLRPLSKKFFFFLKTTGYYGSGTLQQDEPQRMESMARKSKRSTLRELDLPMYEKKEPRIGALPSVKGESQDSLVLDRSCSRAITYVK